VGWAGLVWLAGCATLPKDFSAERSTAIRQDENTSLKSALLPSLNAHTGLSGFFLLDKAEDAFLSRVALADTAEKTIDAQYFIWAGDAAGLILMDRLIKAADRGVRVRILLDDVTSHGKDIGLGVLNKHPLIQIRVFNPLGHRFTGNVSRSISMAFHIGRMTRRMHNKLFAADNQVAIVGGRNIADDYFGLSKKSNFRDMDLMAVGPAVGEASAKFDEFWNCSWSVPMEVLGVKPPTQKQYDKITKRIQKYFAAEFKKFPYALDFSREAVLKQLDKIRSRFVWAQAEVVGDPPGKSWEPSEGWKTRSTVAARVSKVGEESKNEILLCSPYLIISPDSVAHLGGKVKSGVRVRILTNSMMSTDALPVVAHYKGLRESLLSEGVDLYEVRPDAENSPRHSAFNEARHSLHAKVAVFDRKDVFVGTYNIDPRSENLNTEVGLLVHSPELSEQVAQSLEDDLRPVNSWTLGINTKKDLLWKGEKDGKDITFKKDPYAGFWTRFFAGFLSILPIKGQL
jgi:putative cardiolipin synthase